MAARLVPARPTWDVPHRILAAVDYLVLDRRAPDYRGGGDEWPAFRAVLAAHVDFVGRFVREQPIQTNEPQRCWALLPLFLTVARAVGRPLDLLDLGAAAGLNLLWDRYRYEYEAGGWWIATQHDAELAQADRRLADAADRAARPGIRPRARRDEGGRDGAVPAPQRAAAAAQHGAGACLAPRRALWPGAAAR